MEEESYYNEFMVWKKDELFELELLSFILGVLFLERQSAHKGKGSLMHTKKCMLDIHFLEN